MKISLNSFSAFGGGLILPFVASMIFAQTPSEMAPPPPMETVTASTPPFLSAEPVNAPTPPASSPSSATPASSSTPSAPPVMGQGAEATLVNDARIILDEIMAIPVKGIPINLLAKAEGLALFPEMLKGGFILGIQHGNGVLVVKNDKGHWEYPRFVTLTGGSLGFQAGVQSADVILVFCSRRSVESALAGKFTVGADASVSAGPVGRQTSAATDYQLTAEIYSYSRSRGLFLGAAIDGSVMDNNGVGRYYQNGVPDEAKKLLESIIRYSQMTVE